MLVHGDKGKPSNNKTDEEIVKKAAGLYQEKHYDFGPAPAQETLFERDGPEISVSALRRALASAGLWEQKKRDNEYRSRGRPGRVLGNWHSLTAAATAGLRAGEPLAVLLQ